MQPAVLPRQSRSFLLEQGSQEMDLANGRYRLRLNSAGSGFSEVEGVAVSRWVPDKTEDANGFFIYLRDLDSYAAWSAGLQPTRVAPEYYSVRPSLGGVEIERTDDGIMCQLAVCVAPELDFEIRRCWLTNIGTGLRRIELTSYLEWVLASRVSDANHPAFSKLFIETQVCSERNAVLARRRPRSSGEAEFWGFHSLVCEGESYGEAVEFETNRLRFIGRGRTLATPQALEPGAILTSDYGPVLDPCASLRTSVALEPGASRAVYFVLGAAPTRAAIDGMLASAGEVLWLDRILAEAATSKLDSSSARLPSVSHREITGRNGNVIVHRAHAGASPTPAFRANYRAAASRTKHGSAPPSSWREPLQFENGFGGFSADGKEYLIRILPDGHGGQLLPPMPWANVIANEQAGFLVTERGAGYTWSGNSRVNRLTAWHNDPVSDPQAESIWIRDDEAGEFWSPTPGPSPTPNEYRVRHGFGYTSFEHEGWELAEKVTMFMAPDDPVKLVQVLITNRGERTRRLSIFSYLRWALGDQVSETADHITTECDESLVSIMARNPRRELYGGSVAFSTFGTDYDRCGKPSFSCDRRSFIGAGDSAAPEAITTRTALDGRAGSGLDPCAAWQLPFELPAGAEFRCTFILGEAPDRELAVALIRKYSAAQNVEAALDGVREFWRELTSTIQIETPDREIDLMVNGWLVYQNLSCRLWGRSAYYQPGGAFGFRDQLQDSAALISLRPELTRAQIVRHAGQQFVEGDVLHWWHPDSGSGLRTRFSDDLLWLPLITAEYVQKTGDRALLDEQVPFITAPTLAEGQQESFLRPALAHESASLYEHCCRALDRGLTRGGHGLPLIGCGDWNDGFSRVGSKGKGESVWLGFFIEHILQRMLPICRERGDTERTRRYSDYRERLAVSLNSAGWDGGWYRRAFYDNGQPIGSNDSDECQIDALAQAWAIISGIAPRERAELAMQAVENRLICRDEGLIRLLTPPFDQTPNDPGYIKGYLPGIRENGGQYTHGVLWVVQAWAKMGCGTQAVELLRMLTPVWHTSSSDRVRKYQTEPYAVAADIYGEAPHVGRGGWTWYTGSAGWMFRIAVESVFGLVTEGGHTLVVNPTISSSWPECRLAYRLPKETTSYEIVIKNPCGREHGVRSATVDGLRVAVDAGSARIPLTHDGRKHRVVVHL